MNVPTLHSVSLIGEAGTRAVDSTGTGRDRGNGQVQGEEAPRNDPGGFAVSATAVTAVAHRPSVVARLAPQRHYTPEGG